MINYMIVDLPHPEGPTKAIFSPEFILRDTPFKIFFFLVGYLKTTSLSSMLPMMFPSLIKLLDLLLAT